MLLTFRRGAMQFKRQKMHVSTCTLGADMMIHRGGEFLTSNRRNVPDQHFAWCTCDTLSKAIQGAIPR